MKGVERGLIEDVEVGCTVWSTTHQDSNGQIGGVVMDITVHDDEDFGPLRTFHVLRWAHAQPMLTTIPPSDCDPQMVQYFSRNAKVAAQQIVKWLAKQKNLDIDWLERATRLAFLGAGGNLLPKAEGRYQAVRAAEKEEREREQCQKTTATVTTSSS